MSFLDRLGQAFYALIQRKTMTESRTNPVPYVVSAPIQRAALENSDMPVDMIRDVLVAQAEASESFEFDESCEQE